MNSVYGRVAEPAANRAGFTIIEMLLATALLGLVLAFTLQTFTTNNKAYVQVDSVVEMQQNLRTIADLMERDVRHAGMLVPEAGALCGIDNDTAPDVLYVSDHGATATPAVTTPYDGCRVTALSGTIAAGTATLTLDSLFLEPTVADAAYDTDGNGTNDSDYVVGGGVIIFDANDADRGTACGSVTAVSLGSNQIQVTVRSGALGSASGPVSLHAVPAIEYRVAGGDLFRNGLQLAEGTDDFQVAYWFDANRDSVIDAGEIRGDGSSADYVASANNVEDAREMRINLVAIGSSEDPDFPSGHFQALENRDAIAGTDGFRRRSHTNNVRLRNIGNRATGAT